jgi:hypothetical protein
MSESVMTTNSIGNKFWRNSKGEYHRTDGPAIEWIDGDKEWYENGERHRLNGPAIEWLSGKKTWYVNDKCLGDNDKGFWRLWDKLTPKQKKDPVLLSYLPEKF